jgi:hypothetical protein
MKTFMLGMFALGSLGLMGNKVFHVKSLSFSGERYFSIVDKNNRFDTVQERFNALCLVHGVKSTDVVSSNVNGSWCVVVSGKVLVTVTKEDATVHMTSPKKLSEMWAKKLSDNIESITPLN